jgi:hypothetical protein
LDEGAIEEADFNIMVFQIKNELDRHISANDPQSASDGSWVFEYCRLTVVIILEAIETAQDLLSSNSVLTLSLIGALEKTDIGGNWGELSCVLYWVSMIGSMDPHLVRQSQVTDLVRTMSEISRPPGKWATPCSRPPRLAHRNNAHVTKTT